MTLTLWRRFIVEPETFSRVVWIRSDGRFLHCDACADDEYQFVVYHTFLLSDVAELQLSEP